MPLPSLSLEEWLHTNHALQFLLESRKGAAKNLLNGRGNESRKPVP